VLAFTTDELTGSTSAIGMLLYTQATAISLPHKSLGDDYATTIAQVCYSNSISVQRCTAYAEFIVQACTHTSLLYNESMFLSVAMSCMAQRTMQGVGAYSVSLACDDHQCAHSNQFY
jgi:hypothetical protein